MKTNRIFTLLVTLALLILVFIFSKNDNVYFERKKNDFSFNKNAAATEIQINNTENNTVLMFSNNKWVNNEQNEIDKSKVDILFGSLKNLKMQSPVSKKQVNAINEKLENEGTRLQIKKGSKILYDIVFVKYQDRTIGRIANNSPCYLSIQAYNHLELWQLIDADPNHWRNNLLINYSADRIGAIELSFSVNPEQGFSVVNSPEGPVLFNYRKETVTGYSIENVSDYLHFFGGITFAPPDKMYYIKSDEAALFSLNLLTRDKNELKLSGFKLYDTENNSEDNLFFAGVINEQDTVFLRYSNFDPIVLSLDYFLKK